MTDKNENPAALAGAYRVPDTKVSLQDLDTTLGADFQAVYIAQKYRLSPCLARVVCELAHIGGRLL